MLFKRLINALLLSTLYQTSLAIPKNCVHFKRGRVTSWNTQQDMWIDFFIPLDWLTLEEEVMTIRFDKLHDLEIVLKPPNQNLTGLDFEEVEFLPTEDLRVGWNRLLLRIIGSSSVMVLEGMGREEWLRAPVTFKKGETLKAEITGLSSFIDCNDERVYYAVAKSINVTIPVVLGEDDFVDLDILTYRSEHDIRVGINLDGKVLSLCRPIQESESAITDLSVIAECNPKLNMTSSLNHKGLQRLRLTVSLFDEKDYYTAASYTFPRVIVHNLGADPFLVRTQKQSPVEVLFEEYADQASRANEKDTQNSNIRENTENSSSGLCEHKTLLAVVVFLMAFLSVEQS